MGWMVRHMLMLQFHAEASALQIEQVLQQFSALSRCIDGICSIELGENINPENLAKSFSHGVLVTFADLTARDQYLIHPEHKALQQSLIPLLADLLVLDLQSG